MVQVMKEQIEFLQVQVLAGVKDPEFSKVAEDSKEEFLSQAARASAITFSDATTLLKMLLDSPFNASHRDAIIAAVNGRVGGGIARPLKQQLQSLSSFHRLATTSLAEMLSDATATYGMQLGKVVHFLVSIGAVNLNQPSQAHVVACWTAFQVQKHGQVAFLDAAGYYTRLQDVKANVHAIRNKGRLPHYGEIITFPSEAI